MKKIFIIFKFLSFLKDYAILPSFFANGLDYLVSMISIYDI